MIFRKENLAVWRKKMSEVNIENNKSEEKSAKSEKSENSTKQNFRKKISLRIPQTKRIVLANCILFIGLALIILGLVIFLKNFFIDKQIKVLACVINLIIAEICFFICFGFLKLPTLIYFGTFFVLNGILSFFVESEFFEITLAQLWPIVIINTGLSFIPYQLFKFKKFKSSFLFPAILFICLGIIFLLFSLKIIPISFSSFIRLWWPLIFVIVGIALIVTFIVLKTSKGKQTLSQVQEFVDFDGDNL